MSTTPSRNRMAIVVAGAAEMTTGRKVRSLTARTSCVRPKCNRFAYQSPRRVVGLFAATSTRGPLMRVSGRCVQRKVNTWLS